MIRFLQRINAWFRPKPQTIPEDARWVIQGNERVLVVPGKVGTGLIAAVQTDNAVPGGGRPSRVVTQRNPLTAERANREWIVNQAPDVCLFL